MKVVFDTTTIELDDVRSIMIVGEGTDRRVRVCYHDNSIENLRSSQAVEDYRAFINKSALLFTNRIRVSP